MEVEKDSDLTGSNSTFSETLGMGVDARDIGLVLFGGPWDLLSHFVSPVTANLWKGDMTPGGREEGANSRGRGEGRLAHG